MYTEDNIIHLSDLDTGKSEKRRALRAAISTKFGGAFDPTPRCVYCKCELTEEYGPNKATIDHIIPRSEAPHLEHSWPNLVSACKHHNERKGSKDWKTWWRSQPFHDPEREKDIQATLDEWGIIPPEIKDPSTP